MMCHSAWPWHHDPCACSGALVHCPSSSSLWCVPALVPLGIHPPSSSQCLDTTQEFKLVLWIALSSGNLLLAWSNQNMKDTAANFGASSASLQHVWGLLQPNRGVWTFTCWIPWDFFFLSPQVSQGSSGLEFWPSACQSLTQIYLWLETCWGNTLPLFRVLMMKSSSVLKNQSMSYCIHHQLGLVQPQYLHLFICRFFTVPKCAWQFPGTGSNNNKKISVTQISEMYIDLTFLFFTFPSPANCFWGKCHSMRPS